MRNIRPDAEHNSVRPTYVRLRTGRDSTYEYQPLFEVLPLVVFFALLIEETPELAMQDERMTSRMKTTGIWAVSALFFAYAAGVTAAGNPDRGKALFAVCTTCHGARAEGMKEMNAPALAGQEEWYLVRQLQNFRDGIRGADSRDVYGQQMAPMAQVLADDQAIEDVAAYLAGLEE
jgi:cytochrome c553